MTPFETLLKTLSDASGCALHPDEKGLCEMSLQGCPIYLYHQVADGLVLGFGVVKTLEEPLCADILCHALTLSLFGQGTHGFSLGLFGRTLLLSGVFPIENLTAESLVAQLYLLALQVQEVRHELEKPLTSVEINGFATVREDPILTGGLRI